MSVVNLAQERMRRARRSWGLLDGQGQWEATGLSYPEAFAWWRADPSLWRLCYDVSPDGADYEVESERKENAP